MIAGVTSSLVAARVLYDMQEARKLTSAFFSTVGYGISTVVLGVPRLLLTGNVFGDKDADVLAQSLGNTVVASVLAVGISGGAIATRFFLRSPLGYVCRAKWNLDVIESYYLCKSNQLLRSISADEKEKLEKRLAHVRRMLVLSLPGVGVTKFTDKPWLPTYNSERTAEFIQEMKDRYIDYANRLIAVVPHLSVEFGF